MQKVSQRAFGAVEGEKSTGVVGANSSSVSSITMSLKREGDVSVEGVEELSVPLTDDSTVTKNSDLGPIKKRVGVVGKGRAPHVVVVGAGSR